MAGSKAIWLQRVAEGTALLAMAMTSAGSRPCEAQAMEAPADLIARGQLQLEQREFPEAQRSFAEAVALLEAQDADSVDLVAPLLSLGDALVEDGKPLPAAQAYSRAVSILRRDGGLYDVRLLSPLDRQARAFARAGEFESAADTLRLMERISESAYGADSLQNALWMSHLGARFCQYGFFFDGRQRHRDAIAKLEELGTGESRLTALRSAARCPLQELASFAVITPLQAQDRYEGPLLRTPQWNPESPTLRRRVAQLMRREGELWLVRATEIALASPDMPLQQRIDVLLQAGDWFLIKDHVRTAWRYYRQALQLRANDAGATGSGLLDQPVQLFYVVPNRALRSREAPEGARHHVLIEFAVSANGQTRREQVIDRDATRSMVRETLAALQVARYRPRFVEGEPVETAGLRLRQLFAK